MALSAANMTGGSKETILSNYLQDNVSNTTLWNTSPNIMEILTPQSNFNSIHVSIWTTLAGKTPNELFQIFNGKEDKLKMVLFATNIRTESQGNIFNKYADRLNDTTTFFNSFTEIQLIDLISNAIVQSSYKENLSTNLSTVVSTKYFGLGDSITDSQATAFNSTYVSLNQNKKK